MRLSTKHDCDPIASLLHWEIPLKLYAFTIALLLVETSIASDWPQWRGPNRNAVSSETGLLTSWSKPPVIEWEANGIGHGYSSIVISGGNLFTTGRIDGQVWCFALDLKTGKERWKRQIGATSRNVMSTPTVHGKFVYAVDPDGELSCLSTDDGRVVWQVSFSEQFNGRLQSGRGYGESPLIDGEKVICTPGGADAMVVALNRIDGNVIWKATIPDIGKNGRDGAAFSSINISNAAGIRQYVQLVGRGLIGLNAETGKFLWGYNDIANGTANIPTPIVRDDFVFSANGYHAGSVLLKIERSQSSTELVAKEVYRLRGNRFQNHHGGFVLIGNHLFGGHGSNNGLPTCLEFATGKIAWKRRGPGTGSASVVAADGNLYFHYQNGVVALIEANSNSYELKGTFQMPNVGGDSWAHPVIADGKLFLRVKDVLRAYQIRGDSEKSSKQIPAELADLSKIGISVELLSSDHAHTSSFLRYTATSNERVPLLRLNDQHIVDGSIAPTVIQRLSKLDQPLAISFAGTKVATTGIAQVAKLPTLVGLSVELCDKLADKSLEPLAECWNLTALVAAGTDISGNGLQHLIGLKKLVAIDLDVCDNITDDSCGVLGKMPQLRALNLKKTAFEKQRISSQGLQKLATLKDLEVLNLYANNINDPSLEHLKMMSRLQELDLSLTTVTDNGLSKLSHLSKLKKLTLLYSEGFAGPKITNAGLKPLAGLSHLKDLNLIGARISDQGISDLSKLKGLEKLTLVGTRISTEGLRKLRESLPDCQIVAESK